MLDSVVRTMPVTATPTIQYEWSIDAVDANHGARYSGGSSKGMLTSLFALWLKDRGDTSDWDQAPRFGKIVHTYSTLSLPIIAVWLGITEQAIYEEPAPGTQPFEFHGPDGDLLTLARERTESQ